MKQFLLSILCLGGVFAADAQLIDPSFESGTPSGAWTESSTNFGTPLCDALCGNCGGGCGPYDGTWYAWFGGAGGATEEGLMTQGVTIANGTSATLSFWFALPTPGPAIEADVCEVRMDGNVIWSANGTQGAQYATYTEVSIDISAYTDGLTHALSIYGLQSTTDATNFLIDAFNMIIDGNVATDVNDILNHEVPVVIFPSPADDVVNFQFGASADGDATVNIFNLAGQLVIQKSFNEVFNSTFVLNTSELEAGIYVAEVLNNGQRFQQRVLVQH